MCAIKAKEKTEDLFLRIETDLNNLWGELSNSSVTNAFRNEMKEGLSKCEEEFKAAMNGKNSTEKLEKKIKEWDVSLAKAVVFHAMQEIPKGERAQKSHLALKEIERELMEGKMTPTKARHEVKEIMRMKTM